MTGIDLNLLVLSKGGHSSPALGACLMEATSLFAGESFTEKPRCVSPVLTHYGISLNDNLPDTLRQRLKSFIPRLVGTRGDGQDYARSFLALDWLVRTYTPALLDLCPELAEVAAELRNLPVVDAATVQTAGSAARSAHLQTAGLATAITGSRESTLSSIASNHAAIASRTAFGDAASAATAQLPRADAEASRTYAWATAHDAAFIAAFIVGSACQLRGLSRITDAVSAAFIPTIGELQESAIDLFDRMINPFTTQPIEES